MIPVNHVACDFCGKILTPAQLAAFGTSPPRSARVVKEAAFGEEAAYPCARIFCHCCQEHFPAHLDDQHVTSLFLREQQTQEEWEEFIWAWKSYLYTEEDRVHERHITQRWEEAEARMEYEEELTRELEEEERRREEEERYCAVEASVALGRDFAGQPITVTAEQMCSGMYLLGTQGSGKSSLLEHIAYQRLEQNDSVIVLDPHGQLVDNIIARMSQRRLTDTYLLDLSDARAHPFRLNIFHCSDPADETEQARTYIRVFRVFSRLWPEIESGQYVKKMLVPVVTTLIYNPGCTLADVPGWFRKPGITAQAIANIQNPDTRAFWTDDLPSLSPRDRSFQTEPFLNRVNRLLSDGLLRRLICGPGPPLDLGQLIRQRRSLLIKLPVDADVIGEAASLVGVALFSLIYDF
ncbi:type IV secretion system DNA-binding domain-containing protein [Streptomyces olivoreticuli]